MVARALVVVLGGLLGGCAPLASDRHPPQLLAAEVAPDGSLVRLTFDEPLAEARTAIDHEVPQASPTQKTQTEIHLGNRLKPGEGHIWSAEVSDPTGNSTSVAGKFYAADPHPARLRLNEVRIAGSGVHSDFVEIRVDEPGGLGGWTLEVWSTPEDRQRLVFPDSPGVQGDLLVVRFRDPGEVTDSKGGREYWMRESKGLSPSKGLIVLRPRPDAPAVDGLAYTKKPGGSEALSTAAGWGPGPVLDPTGCTATRTWSRAESEWILVTTGAATPGAPNQLKAWKKPSTRDDPTKSKP